MIVQTHRLNLAQLTHELRAAGLVIPHGLATWGAWIANVDDYGDPVEIDASYQAVETAHVAMRQKFLSEYQAEFQTATPERQAVINSILNGLLPPEFVVDDRPWPETPRLPVQPPPAPIEA